MVFDSTPQTSAPLHRTEDLVEIGGFTDGLPCCQEYDLHLRIAILLGKNFHIIPEVGTLVRPRPGSLSRGQNAPMARTRSEVLFRISSEWMRPEHQSKRDHSHVSAVFAQAITKGARKLWQDGKREQAMALVDHAKKLSPDWYKQVYRSPYATFISRFLGFSVYERAHSLLAR